ncbi:dynamin family protein [Streptomyces sp. NPDC046465]|uniref:dynamin family protein n=1 Tax=Streptomyces sp. NPDC046465 TaxID=3155810 RepID=UPI0033C0F4C0
MLHDRADAAFVAADELLGMSEEFDRARAMLAEQRARIAAPLRIALVGRVSSGKSTLANALLGGDRVPTGVEELTYNVNWLRHGPSRTLTVHFTDGTPPQRRDIDELEKLTVRARGTPELAALLRRIDYLEITDPHPYLRAFDLVDTPGLDSHFGEDSANTLRFLALDEGDVRAATLGQAAKADALVLVFARGLASSEEELLRDFTGADGGAGVGGAGPVTTVGALTKVELFWPAHDDPVAEGRRVAGRLMEAAGARRLLYDLCPLASLVGAAAGSCTDEDVADLTALAALPPSDLADRVYFGAEFAAGEMPDVPVRAARRRALHGRFGGYGIVRAAGLIRAGADTRAELGAELYRVSGLADFRALLADHFGHRAELVKLARAVRQLRALPDLDGGSARTRATLRGAAAAVTRLEHAEHAFAELAVLRGHYSGAVLLEPSDAADLLRITGEYGHDPHVLLDLPADAHGPDLLARARERLTHWAVLTADPTYSGATRRACQVVRRSYEVLVGRLAGPGRYGAPGPYA